MVFTTEFEAAQSLSESDVIHDVMCITWASLFHGTERNGTERNGPDRNGPEHLTISRNGTDGTDRTLKASVLD